MTTHDIETVLRSFLTGDGYIAADDIPAICDAIEADRKRRGEPELVGWAVGTTGGGILHASKYTEYEARVAGYSLPLYRLTAPQPAEPVNKTDWSAELSSWSDEDFIQIFHERPDLAKRLRKMLAEPVKVPSFVELKNLAIEYGIKAGPILHGRRHSQLNESERFDAFIHALLARYTTSQPAEPVKMPSDAEIGQILKEILHNSPYGVHQWELWLEFASALFTRCTTPQPAEPDSAKCAECGAELIPVRPGKWQHPDCPQSPRAAESVKTLLDNQEPLGEEFQRVLDEHSWDLYVKTTEPVKVPSSIPAGTEYSVEPHGNGYAIYQGRDKFHHGLNLAHLTECTPEFSKRIESALNATGEPVNVPEGYVLIAEDYLEEMIGPERMDHLRMACRLPAPKRTPNTQPAEPIPSNSTELEKPARVAGHKATLSPDGLELTVWSVAAKFRRTSWDDDWERLEE